jgi:hypothetical protein
MLAMLTVRTISNIPTIIYHSIESSYLTLYFVFVACVRKDLTMIPDRLRYTVAAVRTIRSLNTYT